MNNCFGDGGTTSRQRGASVAFVILHDVAVQKVVIVTKVTVAPSEC